MKIKTFSLLLVALIVASCGVHHAKQEVRSYPTTSYSYSKPKPVSQPAVSRDNPGATDMEKTIIRWYFDSEPRGARVYWRVVSGIPEQVKNTNENYLGTTPFEETRSFDIIGLTYSNARNVQIEIKVSKSGYLDQTKRFNVRQALDQHEISSFYELVAK